MVQILVQILNSLNKFEKNIHVNDTIHDRYMLLAPIPEVKNAIIINSSKKDTLESVETNRIYYQLLCYKLR